MSRRANRINAEWETRPVTGIVPLNVATVEVLMDIRAELRALNALLHRTNFHRIPAKLDAITKNTTKAKRKKVAA